MQFQLGAFVLSGEVYAFGHWDETLDLVKVNEATSEFVTFAYPDGLVHKLSRSEFSNNILWKSLPETWDFVIGLYH